MGNFSAFLGTKHFLTGKIPHAILNKIQMKGVGNAKGFQQLFLLFLYGMFIAYAFVLSLRLRAEPLQVYPGDVHRAHPF